jgi:hypothetical protein
MAGGGRDFIVSILLKATDLASPVMGGVSKEAQALGGAVKGAGMSTQAMGATMSVAGGAIVGSLVASAKAATEYGGKLIDMSARTGASVEALQELGYAATLTGGSLETVETGLKFVQKNAYAAAQGNETAAAAFSALGVEVEDANGNMKSAETLFTEAGNALRNVDDSATRTALSMAVFGRSGTDLIPMFTDAGNTLDGFREQARSLGLVMSEETAAKMDDAGDKIDASMARIKMSGTMMGATVAPVLAGLVEKAAGIVGKITEWANANPALAETLGNVALQGGAVMTVFGPMLMALPSLSAGCKTLADALTLTNVAAKATTVAGWAKSVYGAVAAGYAWAVANTAVAVSFSPVLVAIAAVVVALGAAILIWKEYNMAAETSRLRKQTKETEQRSDEMAAERGWTRKKDGTVVKPAARASGGPVRAGTRYLVGEDGPELMVPASDGTIIPNEDLNKPLSYRQRRFDGNASTAGNRPSGTYTASMWADQGSALALQREWAAEAPSARRGMPDVSGAVSRLAPLVARVGEQAMAQEAAASERKATSSRSGGGDNYTVNVYGPALGDSGLKRLIGDVVREVLEAEKYRGMAIGTA